MPASYKANQLALRLKRDAMAGRLAVLVGAGLSMQPPSNLPSGMGWRDLVVRATQSKNTSRYYRKLRRSLRYRATLPELVFQELEDALGPQLIPFFAEFGLASPNTGHRCLAALRNRWKVPILTTNFDGLLEQAIGKDEGVVHLHGEWRQPAGLVTRLAQTQRGLPASIRRSVAQLLRGRTLVVLGYSGNDADVIPAIHEAQPKEIVWVRRPGDRSATPRPLQRLTEQHRTLFVRADLLGVVGRLAELLQISPAPDESKADRVRVCRLRAASRSSATRGLAEHQRFAVVHNLLLAAGCHRLATTAALNGVRRAVRDHTDHQAWLLNGAADSMRVSLRIREAKEAARRALKLRPRPHSYYRASSWNQLGLAHLEGMRVDALSAIQAFKKALSLLKGELPKHRVTSQESYEVFVARVTNNLGLALAESGNYADAIVAYRKSLSIKRRLGDIVGTATTLTNKAIAGAKSGVGRARTMREVQVAEEICIQYNLRFKHAYLLREIGTILCAAGEKRSGLRMLRRAITVSQGFPGHERLARRAFRRFSAKAK